MLTILVVLLESTITSEYLNRMTCNGQVCVVMSNHVPFTRILIPIPFPRENPIPDSRKIHDRIHSRYQVGSRSYLLLSWRFSRLTCFSELFTTRARHAKQTSRPILDKQVNQLFIDGSVYQAGLLQLVLYLQTVQLS
jgi:hypothetical protein